MYTYESQPNMVAIEGAGNDQWINSVNDTVIETDLAMKERNFAGVLSFAPGSTLNAG